MRKPIRTITAESFARYGTVIAYDPDGPEGFQVVLRESEPVGWRIAANRITARAIAKLARHEGSRESFEPVSGVTVLCVAEAASPDDWELFLLDRPVCLFRNVWHATACLSDGSVVKICENLEVDSADHELPAPIEITAGG